MLLWTLPLSAFSQSPALPRAPFERVVILKIDGLNADLLYRTMREQDAETGKSRLPWFSHVFDQGGTVVENFYVRGISLSAPSWSILDTGQHAVIRGNVEYDRYTGQVYDYLNVFPFYIGYARKHAVDMPGVEVLDRAGIPLLIDRFHYDQTLQSFQLFQRGVSWITLKNALLRSFSGKSLASLAESAEPISLGSSLSKEVESAMEQGIGGPNLLYLDFFTGDADHEGHATSDPAALFHVMRELDALVGRVWTAIEHGPLAQQTVLVAVSDHGMNNVPGLISQTFSLPDLLNSPQGGAHHVITDREQLSDYKLKGINPMVHRVVTPSAGSFYLQGQAGDYPTAWLDIDGNERAAVHLRNSDLNKLHILLQQLARSDLNTMARRAVAENISETLEKHRASWNGNATELAAELVALGQAIAARKQLVARLGSKITDEQNALGEDKQTRRLRRELQQWENEETAYRAYLTHLNKLLTFEADRTKTLRENVRDLIPAMSLGEKNTVGDLEHYIVGLQPAGVVVTADGKLDEGKSFRYIDNFAVIAAQRARNNPQAQLSNKPIDFIAMALPEDAYDASLPKPQHAYWLYGDAENQLVILQDEVGRLSVRPVRNLHETTGGRVTWREEPWHDRLPLRLFEDEALALAPNQDRTGWLSSWHTEQEWFAATHKCRYSNAVIGITEEMSPVGPLVPGRPGIGAILRRYEQRRRELVQADFHVFAADHWNFNVRFPNPGGNHGGFVRISTHSVWMMAGAGLPVQQIEQPFDSLAFTSTVLSLLGRTPPMPERVIRLAGR